MSRTIVKLDPNGNPIGAEYERGGLVFDRYGNPRPLVLAIDKAVDAVGDAAEAVAAAVAPKRRRARKAGV